jgi:hypothetical protein
MNFLCQFCNARRRSSVPAIWLYVSFVGLDRFGRGPNFGVFG